MANKVLKEAARHLQQRESREAGGRVAKGGLAAQAAVGAGAACSCSPSSAPAADWVSGARDRGSRGGSVLTLGLPWTCSCPCPKHPHQLAAACTAAPFGGCCPRVPPQSIDARKHSKDPPEAAQLVRQQAQPAPACFQRPPTACCAALQSRADAPKCNCLHSLTLNQRNTNARS